MDYESAADGILAKKPRARRNPTPAPELPEIVTSPSDTLADAYANGFEASSRVSGRCCGCNTYSEDPVNPYSQEAL